MTIEYDQLDCAMTIGGQFIGTCVHLSSEHLDDFDESASDTDLDELISLLGEDRHRDIERQLNSFFSYHRPDILSLRTDYHVRYHKGLWRGKPAVCVMHSSTHFLWYYG